MMNSAVTILLALLAGILFSPSGFASSNCKARGKTWLKVGVSSLPKSLDPQMASGVNQVATTQLTHKGLIHTNEFGEIVPGVARSWRFQDSMRKFSFCLGPTHFSNGKRIAVEDIRFSLKRVLRLPNYSNLKQMMHLSELEFAEEPALRHEEQAAGLCFSISSPQPVRHMINFLAQPIFPIVPEGDHDAKVGLGSYQVESQQPGRLILSRKERQASKPDCISIREIEFDHTIDQRVASGELDIFIGVNDLQKLPEIIKKSKVIHHDGLYTNHLYYNLRSEIIKNSDFRRDLGRLIKTAYLRYGQKVSSLQVTDTYLPRGLAVPSYYRSQESMDLDDKEFVARWIGLLTRGPTRLRMVACLNELDSRTLDYVQRTLQQVGITFEYVFEPKGRYYEFFDDGDYDIAFVAAAVFSESADSFVAFPLDYLAIRSKDFKRVLARYRKQIFEFARIDDNLERKEKVSKVFQDLQEEVIFYPFFRYRVPIIVSGRIKLPYDKYRFFLNLDLISFS
jgi:MarR-like DNA-binding transcriptional regulator SgrR of sgrS sRNA